MRIISLTKIEADRRQTEYSDTDDVGENAAATQVAQTQTVSINAEAIRCFYPRRNNQPGTRITFTDGGGFAVAESYEEVNEKLSLH